MQSIIENGYIAKPYIGVSVDDVSEETQSYGLPQGAAVKSVTQDSPAEEAGLQVNDIITKAGDTEISGSKDLVDVVGAASVGDQLVLTVYRQGQTIEVTVTVGEEVQSALAEEESGTQQSPSNQGGFPWGFGGYGN